MTLNPNAHENITSDILEGVFTEIGATSLILRVSASGEVTATLSDGNERYGEFQDKNWRIYSAILGASHRYRSSMFWNEYTPQWLIERFGQNPLSPKEALGYLCEMDPNVTLEQVEKMFDESTSMVRLVDGRYYVLPTGHFRT